MKRLILLVLAVIVAGAVGLAAYYKHAGASHSPTYTTATVTSGPVLERVQATGTLQAVTTVEVGSQVSGTISSLHADFNSQVQQGPGDRPARAVAVPDAGRAGRSHRAAAAGRCRARGVEVDDAKAKLRRAEELSTQQLIPASDLDTARTTARQAEAALKSARAQVAQARAALNQTRVNLDHTIITAPIDGIVVSRNVDVGQTVAASMQAPTLFVLAEDLTAHAGERERRRGRHRPDPARTAGQLPGRRVSATRCSPARSAGAARSRRRAERRQLRHRDRRAESRAEAEAGHDGERDDRDRPGRRRAARAERGAALPAGRGARPLARNAPRQRAPSNPAAASRAARTRRRAGGVGARR